MASAVLASRNEPCWGEQKAFMRKPSISNSNPNPNPRPGTLISVSGDRAAFRPSHFSSRDADLGLPPIGAAGPRSAASDEDSSSLNPWLANAAAVAGNGVGGCLRFNISALSKSDLRDLKRRLASELEQVRGVINRIETAELQSLSRSASFAAGFGSSPAPGNEKVFAGVKGVHYLSSSTRGKLLGAATLESEKLLKSIMSKCGQILAKLMKPKKSIWFNSPVDVVGLGLHDYHNVIKSPMDLGTVKTKLNKGLYASPVEFAADIRLTFNNALLYNHQTHEVYKIAESLLSQFEGLYEPAFDKYQRQLRELEQEEDHGPTTVVPSTHFLVPETSASRSEKKHTLPKAQSMVPTPSPIPTPVPSQPPPSFPPKQHHVVVNREPTGRLPKPKARDPNKRTMSFEEKKKLGQGLESLPLDKMAQVVQIIRKRKVDAMQDGDEIELDIELMDTETLWELDRFLYNCKKMTSKVRKQGNTESGLHEGNCVIRPTHLPMEDVEKSPLPVGTPDVGTAKKSKKGDAGEEDVDILDDMPPAHYPSVEIEKDVAASSSTSSSDSDSSSSSGSDSETSSGSSSDEDDPQPSCPGGGRSSPGK